MIPSGGPRDFHEGNDSIGNATVPDREVFCLHGTVLHCVIFNVSHGEGLPDLRHSRSMR